ncbi:acyl-CoA dehydrogenase family protein [Reyranella sp.]|uniref:acyl-CoA dehydrogenase family protein n=1 Tax=Reyranella sp. TaxID=1929291 RepID=UPI003D09D066
MTGNDTRSALLDVARSWRPRLLAERDRIEALRRLPDDVACDLAQAGFFRILLPEAYGGLDLTPMQAMAVFEELARADASVAWCVWNGNTHWVTAQLPAETARTIHASPAAITANSTRASGRARVVDGGYRVSGRWALVSGCELASWQVLLAIVHEGDKPRLAASGAPETRFMLVPSAECAILDTWTVGGLRGTGSHDVVVDDRFVPQSHAASFTDPYVLAEPRYRIPPFSKVIPGLGAMALGIACNAIETLIEIASEKVPQRTSQSLRENHGAQVRVSQAESLVRSARLFLLDSLQQLWSALLDGRGATMQARAQARLAASLSVGNAVQAVDLMYAAAGATALYATCPLERAFRDVHAITQHIGVTPRVRESPGRVLFGRESDPPLL